MTQLGLLWIVMQLCIGFLRDSTWRKAMSQLGGMILLGGMDCCVIIQLNAKV